MDLKVRPGGCTKNALENRTGRFKRKAMDYGDNSTLMAAENKPYEHGHKPKEFER